MSTDARAMALKVAEVLAVPSHCVAYHGEMGEVVKY
jgi:hypothetical protein